MLLNSRSKKDTQQQQKLKQTDKINRRSFPLPPELLYEILNYLEGCQPALYSACLVCKQWFYCAAPILYCHPQINDTYLWATFILTLTRERMSFSYGNLIRSIDLSSGKSIEAMKDQEFYRRLSSSNINPFDNNPNSNNHSNNDNNNNVTTTVSNYTYGNGFNVHVITRSNTNTDNSNHRYEHHIYNNTVPPQSFNSPTSVPLKGLPYIIVSTSSLIQLSHTCKYITTLNLSYTSLLNDSVIAETGEYLSTLQHYANSQPGLTHIQIPIEAAIKAIGKECQQLVQVKVQRCEWVTAHVIWMFVYYCKNLKRLDARRSTKCTIKKLIASVLESTEVLLPTSSLVYTNNNTVFAAPPSSSISTSSSTTSSTNEQQLVYMPQHHEDDDNDDDMDDMDQLNTNDHIVFNEETGSYDQQQQQQQQQHFFFF
ncbi:hypothetical protein K501DRAFT_330638 [Backusella circina FSU 941]|nr:hypothetical protein K501DRAFT_330638 [Backusella circina FSU 941]